MNAFRVDIFQFGIVSFSVGKDGEDGLITFLLNFTLLQLEHQVLKLGKEVVHGLKVAWV